MNTWLTLSNNPNKKFQIILFLSMILLLLSCLFSILLGAVNIEFKNLIQTFLHPDPQDVNYSIIFYVRIPRTIAACFAGAALATSGAILQTVMNNALASPSVIGVNSGAALCALIVFIYFPYAYELLPLAAFIGALATSLLVYFIALKTGASRISIILSGVAISNLLGAFLDFITIMYPDSSVGATSFMIGGFSGITMSKLIYPMIYILIALSLSLLFSSSLNILSLGDEIAHGLGLNIKKQRFLFICLAALLAGSAISFAGLLGFVGLLVPHIVRMIVGSNHHHILPLTIVLGAAFVTICDILVRTIFSPYEIPVGIMLSFLGGPFFIWLLLNSKRGKLNV